jgi:hypothetical protein
VNITGTASAAATSVAIPAHAIGDLLMVFTRAASNTAPTKPTATGTVPNWNVPQTAGANTLALASAWVVASAANHTTGAWTGASHICVLVLRPAPGKKLNVPANSTVGSGNNTQNIVYPALSLTAIDGTSWGIRCGTRGTAVTAVGTAPTGWTAWVIQPAGASCLMSVHARSGLTVNPVADTVATAGTNAAYRAHTFEVTEVDVPQPMVTIA